MPERYIPQEIHLIDPQEPSEGMLRNVTVSNDGLGLEYKTPEGVIRLEVDAISEEGKREKLRFFPPLEDDKFNPEKHPDSIRKLPWVIARSGTIYSMVVIAPRSMVEPPIEETKRELTPELYGGTIIPDLSSLNFLKREALS